MPKSQDSVFVVKSMKGYVARTALLDAALELVAEHGLSGFSIGQLCHAANIKRTSFYTYFKTIDDLVEELSLREDAAFDQRFTAMFGEMQPGVKRLFISIIGFFRIALENKVWNRAVIRMMSEHEQTLERNMGYVEEDIQTAITQGDLEIEASELNAFKNLVFSALQHTEATEFQSNPVAYTATLIEMLLRASKASEATCCTARELLVQIQYIEAE